MSRTTRTPSLSPWFAKLFSGKMGTRSPGRGFRPTSGAPRTTITPLGTLPGARIPSPGAGEPACRVWWAGAAGERSGRRRRGAHRMSRILAWLYYIFEHIKTKRSGVFRKVGRACAMGLAQRPPQRASAWWERTNEQPEVVEEGLVRRTNLRETTH